MNTLDGWLAAVSRELVITDSIERDAILGLTRDVAHGVARPAAPLTAFLLGMAVGRGLDTRQAAQRIRELAQGWNADAAGSQSP